MNMSTPQRNSHGLYDAPNFGAKREPLAISQEDLQRQLEAGAFVLDRDEAIRCGLVNPYDDETDTVILVP
jgi:hypothetical protein